MKKILVALAVAAFASTASATVAGSSHDLRDAPFNGTFPSACMYCHTPHHSTSAIAPLWARTDPASITVTGVFGGGSVSDRNTKTCLTCHGSAAGVTGIGGVTTNLSGDLIIGTNLATEHPVGSAATYPGSGAAWQTGNALFDAAYFTFAAGSAVECATCHDVHNSGVQAGTRLLRAFTGGDFCGACHVK